MKKIISLIVAIAIGCCIGYYLGGHEIYRDIEGNFHSDSYKEMWLGERVVASAAIDLLHRFYSNDDNDEWYEKVIPSKEYARLDSALQGDWEDFYLYESPNILWEEE